MFFKFIFTLINIRLQIRTIRNCVLGIFVDINVDIRYSLPSFKWPTELTIYLHNEEKLLRWRIVPSKLFLELSYFATCSLYLLVFQSKWLQLKIQALIPPRHEDFQELISSELIHCLSERKLL